MLFLLSGGLESWLLTTRPFFHMLLIISFSTSTIWLKLGLYPCSTSLHDETRSDSLGSTMDSSWSFSFSPLITFYAISCGSRPSYGTSRFIISHSKLP